ncbi:PPOX class F420-dependent oxidoreductase [Ornithinimicrobium faecis]|uniref:PPOX class F420-dependent oxidoreductase n=1 Tax=Ornithinimicrobium faecis TaxID=2934158 RepID=A0ABY4YUG0_9MICO|nr:MULTISPECIES: PPOX class F420-dependent oxidoreductase [unclassified Ornithinimicrobium]USQ80413.1 PPOX class F420-dependent oxidoreductase [Ornithinimicrobium sp. HY1793]
MSTSLIPDDKRHLLDNPNFGVLGTIRPDDTVQTSPMWFEFDGETVRFTHTTTRQKFRNLQHNASMSMAVYDPDNPVRYLEVRGRLVEVVPDPTGAFYDSLHRRYGGDGMIPPDAADRVILVMSVEKTAGQ